MFSVTFSNDESFSYYGMDSFFSCRFARNKIINLVLAQKGILPEVEEPPNGIVFANDFSMVLKTFC